MRTHVKVLGVLQIIFGVVALLFALGGSMILGLLSNVANHNGDPDSAAGSLVLGLAGIAAGIFFGVIGAAQIICGIGVLKFQSWARIVGIICCGFSLFSVPLGTIFGVYGLWVLFNKETEALFKTGGAAADPAPSV
jgi:hypothetical protein